MNIFSVLYHNEINRYDTIFLYGICVCLYHYCCVLVVYFDSLLDIIIKQDYCT